MGGLFLRVCLLVLKLLHGQDVVEQPLEDDSIAVDGDIDYIYVGDLLEALSEVPHILFQKRA